jgi:hypothetical protein
MTNSGISCHSSCHRDGTSRSVGFCSGLSFFIDDQGLGFFAEFIEGKIGGEVARVAIAVEFAVNAEF